MSISVQAFGVKALQIITESCSEACTQLFSTRLRLENTNKELSWHHPNVGSECQDCKDKLSLIRTFFLGTISLAVLNNLLVQFYSLYRSF